MRTKSRATFGSKSVQKRFKLCSKVAHRLKIIWLQQLRTCEPETKQLNKMCATFGSNPFKNIISLKSTSLQFLYFL